MNRYFINPLLITMVLLLASAAAFAGSRDGQVANVTVYTHTLLGKTAYTYTIKNTGNRSIIGFSIGFDHYTGTSELCGDHPHQVITPDPWQSRIISLEESQCYEVRWESASGAESLKPGGAKSGFTVLMNNPNPQLLNGHWTVIIDGPPTYASSKFKLVNGPPDDLDMTPPSISVEVEPDVIWPPNKKMVRINANVTVSDNRDSSPVISLVSVTCNECDPSENVNDVEVGAADFDFSVRASRTGQAKPGRVYTVVYSATDSTGNRSEGSATITVPHDQRLR